MVELPQEWGVYEVGAIVSPLLPREEIHGGLDENGWAVAPLQLLQEVVDIVREDGLVTQGREARIHEFSDEGYQEACILHDLPPKHDAVEIRAEMLVSFFQGSDPSVQCER